MLATYLIRLGSTSLRALGRERLGPLEEVRLSLRAWPVDLDTNLHVNNGRYLTLMDFGRYHQAIRTGLLGAMVRNRWWPLLGAASIRYRREIRVFDRFDLVTRLAFWDEKWFYMEQRFERAGEVHASAFVRGVLKQRGRTIPPAALLRAVGHDGVSPPPPSTALSRFIEAQAA